MKFFFKQCFFLLDKQAKKKLPFLFLIFLFSSLFDVVGIGLVGAFLLLIVNFDNMIHKLPTYLQAMLLAHFDKNEIIALIGFGMIFAFLIKAFYCIFSQKSIVMFTSRFAVRLKMRLMVGFQNADYAFHLRQNSAYLINKVSFADNFSNGVISTCLNMLSSSLVVLGVTGALIFFHPFATLFLFIMIGILFFSYEFFVKNRLFQMGKMMSLASGEINKNILQAMGGLKEIRVLGKEFFFRNKIKSVALGYSQSLSAYNALLLIPRYAIECIASVFLVSMVLAALLIGTSPLSMIPALGIFSAACIRLLPTISQLIGQYSQLRTAGYVTGVLYDEVTALENRHKTNLSDNTLSQLHFSHISLKNILFCYHGAKNIAINDVCLDIFRGQSIGLIGTSGSGKSTLLNILLGLLTPNTGEVLVDNKRITEQRAWLNNFAYIPQSIFLLDDTLKRNIALGTEDQDIDERRLFEAISMAQLSEVVAELPDSVDTMIGENGVRLSGGQRQRVALARALYYDREIIVMDEATSALDNETESEVINSIKRLHGVKTLIVIAHRLSTIEHCDIVYKLEKGKIVTKGSFDQVITVSDSVRAL